MIHSTVYNTYNSIISIYSTYTLYKIHQCFWMLVPTVSTGSPFSVHQRTAQCRCRALLRRMTMTPPDLPSNQSTNQSNQAQQNLSQSKRMGYKCNIFFRVKLRGFAPQVPILNHGCRRVGSCALLQCVSCPISMLLRWLKHLSRCYILVLVYIHSKKIERIGSSLDEQEFPTLQYSPLSFFWEVPPILNISFISEVTKRC